MTINTSPVTGFSYVERSQAGAFSWEYCKTEYLDGEASHIESIRFSCGHWRHQAHPSRAVSGDERWCFQCGSPQRIIWSKAKSGKGWALPEDIDPYQRRLKQRQEEAEAVRDALSDPSLAHRRARSRLMDTIKCAECPATFERAKRGRSVHCQTCRDRRKRKANRKRATGIPRSPGEVSVTHLDMSQAGGNQKLAVVRDRQPAKYKTPAGSKDGCSTYFTDLAGELDTLAEAAENHPWWEANKGWAADQV